MSKKVKKFFVLENQLRNLAERVLSTDNFTKSGRGLSLYLTEIYFRSIKIAEIIAAIKEIDRENFDKKNIDKLLTHLINLRIEIYDEVLDWMNALRAPLKVTINETSKRLSEYKQISNKKQTKRKQLRKN